MGNEDPQLLLLLSHSQMTAPARELIFHLRKAFLLIN